MPEAVDFTSILVAAMSMIGTMSGVYFSNRKTQAVVELRLKNLEDKVSVHNHLVERMYKTEEHQAVIDEQLKNTEKRIEDIEKAVH